MAHKRRGLSLLASHLCGGLCGNKERGRPSGLNSPILPMRPHTPHLPVFAQALTAPWVSPSVVGFRVQCRLKVQIHSEAWISSRFVPGVGTLLVCSFLEAPRILRDCPGPAHLRPGKSSKALPYLVCVSQPHTYLLEKFLKR